MMKHNGRKNTLIDERVNKIGLNVSFLQKTVQVFAHHVNIQTEIVSDSTATFPIISECLGC